MILTNLQKQQAAKVICNCRELCGAEQVALTEWMAENGINHKNQALRQQAFYAANLLWNQYRRAAGVKGY